MCAAAVARPAVNPLDGVAREHTLALSAALWSPAFLLCRLRYAPWPMRPRLDGKPG